LRAYLQSPSPNAFRAFVWPLSVTETAHILDLDHGICTTP
jgi:hypothetical protein